MLTLVVLLEENKATSRHFSTQFMAMARLLQLCHSYELDYFYVIARYHGTAFPGHDKFALDFFREHKVLPISVTCPNCNSDLVYRADRNQWYCNSSVRVPKTKRRRRCGYVVSDFKREKRTLQKRRSYEYF